MREQLLMDDGWLFHRGDVEEKTEHGYMYIYMHTKTERGRGPASIDHDDADWEKVTLPHDYVVYEKPTPKENPVHGSLPRKQAWYRRTFRLDKDDNGKQISLIFEGICSQCKIWINGCYMGFSDSAYTEIRLDMTDIARFGDDLNTVAVYIDNSEYEGWWYEGAGIYRHVWLVKKEKTAVAYNGIYVHPEHQEGENWEIPVDTTVENTGFSAKTLSIVQTISDAAGQVLDRMEESVTVLPRSEKKLCQIGKTISPHLWSVEDPCLHTLRTEVVDASNCSILDCVETVFGFRTVVFDPDQGLLLNGIPTKVKGMCCHEDHGGLGTALPDTVKEYRIRCLKKMGCNGYRTAHNPHSRETLDACDRLGMLVMDENRWFESSENGLRRLRSTVLRDRNHPSVILWSVGNEESLQDGERGRQIMLSMKTCIHQLDETRPVLMAMHTGLLEDGAADSADMIGMNYNIGLCEEVHKKRPDKAIIFSECMDANDEDCLGDREQGIETWKIVHENPYMSGMFAWTGFDYRGEHDYPGLFAMCGCMDQNGYPKECYSLYRSWWTQDTFVSIEPNREPGGDPLRIRVTASGDQVRLYQNGSLLGTKDKDYYHAPEWKLDSGNGILRAESIRNGVIEAVTEAVLMGEPDHLELVLENPDEKTGNGHTAILTLKVLDKDGYLLPYAQVPYRIARIDGGRLLVTGNGDVEDQADRHLPDGVTYRGIAQILIGDIEETLQIAVAADGMKQIDREFYFACGNVRKSVPRETSRYITVWEMAKITDEKPMIQAELLEKMEGYKRVEVGHGTQMHDLSRDSGFMTYRAVSRIPQHGDTDSLAIRFELLEGKADVMILLQDKEGKTVQTVNARKAYEEPGELSVQLPTVPLNGSAQLAQVKIEQVQIYVCVEIFMTFCGITKPVRWEIGESNEI